MRNTKSIISILLSIVLLFSSISVGSIVSFADATTLTRIENTFDDEGVEYTAYDENTLRMSKRTVNGVADRFDFAVWGASVEKYSIDSSSEQNGVRFTAAETITSAYPAVVKLYDNNTEDKAQFQPKANTSYSIKFKYNVTAAAGQDVFFQLRQRNTPWPAGKYTYNEADILLSSIATITKNTTTDGWVEASATFTTSATPAYLFLNLSATAYTSGFEVWVDDIVIEELYDVTVNNYTPNQNKTIGMAQGLKASEITVPTVNGCRFDGIYADADYTVPLSPETVLDSYAGGTLYFKWVTLTPQQYLCNFENYTGFIVPPYDKTVSSLVSDTVYYGAKAMKVALQANGITAFEIRDKEAFDIAKDVTYEVSFAYKTDADAEVSVGLAKATDICGSAVAYATTTVTGADSWQTAKLTITADKGTSESYALAMLVFAENGANVYFDDILVTDMSEFETVTMPNVSTDTYPTIGEVKEIWDGSVSESLEGDGTEESPYLIKNGADLAYAIKIVGGNDKYYKLTSDIYLNDLSYIDAALAGTAYNSNLKSWHYSVDNPAFSGTIDGDNHTVYGLYHRNTTTPSGHEYAVALVPSVAAGKTVTIKNLGIDASYIEYRFQASAFVGVVKGESASYANVNIDNCYVGSQVKLKSYYSGAFKAYGIYDTTTITNSYSLATTEAASGSYGLIGYYSATATNISNTYNANGPISTCSAGKLVSATVTNCYETEKSGHAIFNDATLLTKENMQGTDVLTSSDKMANLNTNNAFIATKGYPVLTSFVKEANGGSSNENVAVWDGTVSTVLEGEGTEASPYLIKSGGDLAYAITSGGANDKFYKITCDIYLNDETDFDLNSGYTYDTNLNTWYFDQAFAGTIDGDGHTIYGLYYRNENIPSRGFVGSLYGTGLVPRVLVGATVTIKNLVIDKSYIANCYNASAFVGVCGEKNQADGVSRAVVNIDRCYVGSQVKMIGYDAGAFVGGSKYGDTNITNSYSLATAEASNAYGLIGGLSGSTANISNCYNANGPIASAGDPGITNCYETVQSKNNKAIVVSKQNMIGSDVLTNAEKMPNLGSAFVPAYNETLNDYYIYLPAGTVFEEEYSVNCFDSFFVSLENDAVFNDAGMMTRGAYISFNELPDTTKVVIPSEVYDFVRYGTKLELAKKDTYYGDRMNTIRKTLGSQPEDAVNYLFITDIHYSATYFLAESLKNQIKLMVKTANEDDSIDFICIGGDSINGSFTKSKNLELLNAIYTPLLDCQKPVMIVQGNHDDGSYQQGTLDISQMFSHKDWRDNIINQYVNRTLSDGTEIKVVNNSNDDNPEYYYYDLENKNTRLVVLDSIDYDMTYDENGTITGLEIIDETLPETDHNRYKNGYTYYGYSKEQLKWLADEALGKLPDGYDVVFLSHMGIDERTSGAENLGEELRGIIGAYQNKTAYINEDFEINVDYSAEQGRIRSFQYGHTHSDHKRYDTDIDLIQINTATANGYNKKSRSLYSETEARFDVMSVTNDYVYQMCVGTKGTSMQIYYPCKNDKGDVNIDETVDICDLVYLGLIYKGADIKKTTATDIERTGVIASQSVLRSILLGTYTDTSDDNQDVIIDESKYTPSTVTLTLYDADSYGVTWQTADAPYEPVVQVSKGDTFDPDNYVEFEATSSKQESYDTSGASYNYFVSKAVISGLEAGSVYTYRCYDKCVNVAGESYTFTTRNDANESSFKFVHVADSQTRAATLDSPDGSGTGGYYANTMKGVELNGFDNDFIVHSGDIVEWSKYESYWSSMIGDNDKYFAEVPVMAIAGNHEASYNSGSYELYKHFNYNIHSQDVSQGFSYSFDYGNTKFIMLDTNGLTDNQLPSDEYTWLSETLANNTQKWTVVVMHNPMYSVGVYGSNPDRNAISLALREQLGDLFAENGVDLVIQGHDHAYSKTYPIGVDGAINNELEYENINGIDYCTNANGVIYVMHGPAGNQVRAPYSSIETEYYETYSGSHTSSWAEVEVTDELLTVNVYYYNDGSPELWISYGIKK